MTIVMFILGMFCFAVIAAIVFGCERIVGG